MKKPVKAFVAPEITSDWANVPVASAAKRPAGAPSEVMKAIAEGLRKASNILSIRNFLLFSCSN